MVYDGSKTLELYYIGAPCQNKRFGDANGEYYPRK